jgi:uncharacterized protein (DUF433 family)
MDKQELLAEILSLPVEERLKLVEAIWASISAAPEALPLTHSFVSTTCGTRSSLHESSVMLDWSDCPAVERNRAKLSGAWAFRGTRIPLSALFENLEDGATVEQFLSWFPGVARDQVDVVLEHAARKRSAPAP